MSVLAGHELSAADLINALSTWHVSSSAAGSGVSTVETKDASGDLTFTAVSGFTYTLKFMTLILAGASGHIVDINIRDGGVSSPTSASTALASGSWLCGTTTSIRLAATLVKEVACPADIAAGTHKIAAFYVRNANGATTNNVQLENAGPNRRLSVSSAITGA